ncbi:MAG: glyoxylate/hydroxypyruvate reductase A [Pseudohongiellaceae bacterium]|jgi:glyoxylate/hydroxypyruvate reductase A
MTKVIIPFAHSLSDDDTSYWLNSLNAAIPEIDIREISKLTDAERAAAEVALVANPNPATLKTLPRLKWVQSLWAGVEGLLEAMPDSTVEIVRLTDPQLADTMAEAVLAWTLYLHRDMPRYAAQQKHAIWQQHELTTAARRRVSVLGLGQLGQVAAVRLATNGFSVCGWSRSPKYLKSVQTFSGADEMTSLLSDTDILVILLPSTPSTRGLLNGSVLDCLPYGAQIINFSRADILDTEALVDRLENGRISHAVLDVFEQEPLAPDDLLWQRSNVTVLPHISAPTNRGTAAAIISANLRGWLANGTIPTSISRYLGY